MCYCGNDACSNVGGPAMASEGIVNKGVVTNGFDNMIKGYFPLMSVVLYQKLYY